MVTSAGRQEAEPDWVVGDRWIGLLTLGTALGHAALVAYVYDLVTTGAPMGIAGLVFLPVLYGGPVVATVLGLLGLLLVFGWSAARGATVKAHLGVAALGVFAVEFGGIVVVLAHGALAWLTHRRVQPEEPGAGSDEPEPGGDGFGWGRDADAPDPGVERLDWGPDSDPQEGVERLGHGGSSTASPTAPPDRPMGITLLSVVLLASGLLGLLGGLLSVSLVAGAEGSAPLAGLLVLGTLTVLVNVAALAIGVGLYQGRRWSWWGIQGLLALSLLTAVVNPFSLLLAGPILWYLHRDEVDRYFERSQGSAGGRVA